MKGYTIRKIFFKIFVLAFCLVACNTLVLAQPCGPGFPEGCDPGDPDLPIDGGASILIAAGVAYGLKKAYDQRRQDKKGDIS